MKELLDNIVPILMLIAFGYFLRRRNYFAEATVKGLTSFIATILVPCVLFNTFLNLNFDMSHVWLAAAFFVLQLIYLGFGFVLFRFIPARRRFYPLYFACCAFGFMAIPLFTTVFGADRMEYLAAIGIGHELFVGLVFMTVAKLWLKNEKVQPRTLVKTLISPLNIMVVAALLIKVLGLRDMLDATLLGHGLFSAISKLGGITTVLIMIIVGYRIRFDDRRMLAESAKIVALRYAVTFAIGYAFKFLLMDPLAGGSIWFDYAFFTMLSQHGSVLLVAYVGDHGSKEDLEVASNALVINELAGIVLYLIFVFTLV